MFLQVVELHFESKPECDYVALTSRAEELLGEEVDRSDVRQANKSFIIFHKAHAVEFEEGAVPPQTVLFHASGETKLEAHAEIIQQSWRFPDCEEVLSRSRHTILLTEMMAHSLEPQMRVYLFHAVLEAVVELTKPIGMAFKHSQQIIDPADYLASVDKRPILRPGAVNVRYYTISNSPGDAVMDTRGLTEIGLHDLQCHFRGLSPDDVAAVLFNTAIYIFDQGPVIESGNTIAGIEANSKWVCQFEQALISPDREVLDLNPGAPFAAGER